MRPMFWVYGERRNAECVIPRSPHTRNMFQNIVISRFGKVVADWGSEGLKFEV